MTAAGAATTTTTTTTTSTPPGPATTGVDALQALAALPDAVAVAVAADAPAGGAARRRAIALAGLYHHRGVAALVQGADHELQHGGRDDEQADAHLELVAPIQVQREEEQSLEVVGSVRKVGR